MGDRVHEVGLAEADTPIEEERIEGDRTALGNPAGSGMGELVRLADHEIVKGEARVELRAGQCLLGLIDGFWRRRGERPGDGGHGSRRFGALDGEGEAAHAEPVAQQQVADRIAIVA